MTRENVTSFDTVMITDFLSIKEIATIFHRRAKTVEQFLAMYSKTGFLNTTGDIPSDILMAFYYAERNDITRNDVIDFCGIVVNTEEPMKTEIADDVEEIRIYLEDKNEFASQEFYDYCNSNDIDDEDTNCQCQIEEYDGEKWTVHEVFIQNQAEYHIRIRN